MRFPRVGVVGCVVTVGSGFQRAWVNHENKIFNLETRFYFLERSRHLQGTSGKGLSTTRFAAEVKC